MPILPHHLAQKLPTPHNSHSYQIIAQIERNMGAEITSVSEIEEVMSNNVTRDLPLLSLNHVSFVCKSVNKSVQFYEQVLGFVLIKRPSSFDFKGAWYVPSFYFYPLIFSLSL